MHGRFLRNEGIWWRKSGETFTEPLGLHDVWTSLGRTFNVDTVS